MVRPFYINLKLVQSNHNRLDCIDFIFKKSVWKILKLNIKFFLFVKI